jgi:hypothetical protein
LFYPVPYEKLSCYSQHWPPFKKYAERYLGAFAYRFNRRFNLYVLTKRLLVAAIVAGPHPAKSLRLAETH